LKVDVVISWKVGQLHVLKEVKSDVMIPTNC